MNKYLNIEQSQAKRKGGDRDVFGQFERRDMFVTLYVKM